jgi:hypothetical protein
MISKFSFPGTLVSSSGFKLFILSTFVQPDYS